MGGPPVEVCPSLLGATGWQPKVYNPKTGYLYIPSNEFCMRYAYVADLTYRRGELFTRGPSRHLNKGGQAGGPPRVVGYPNKAGGGEGKPKPPLSPTPLTPTALRASRAPPAV